ncbi:S-methyl-5-thioribose-1-phosphate isomerase [Nitrogeniibacter mangrovi]|uniref:Methylthioribose-1-phosphate isomerase n=1 Tax=Nitrogeniibacter mangrovi TaxID=2016596 RepID=A0A6C1B7R6_9RHOO|nr:S-methyl-5-thioribose-1-phosphate isomerase [Nitrogeniibacter mangrovi]QID18989.1 S-methyl-5-thioribose-1-phosphate isomerase [Nitrogeniibacter mangrovi]
MAHLPPLEFTGNAIRILDQTRLPHAEARLELRDLDAVAAAITDMRVRGAPLIGATAACGVALALRERADDATLAHALAVLGATRPTAVNLHWALARMARALDPLPAGERAEAAAREAAAIIAEDAQMNARIGQHGLGMLRTLAEAGHGRVNVMTHCNAGWLATLEHGTALSPIYAAHAEGIDVHVWVSETRPRNQGLLTAWELAASGVPLTLVADNAAGLLMARGQVDVVITGADRVAANGDSANKIGTYLKALAAADNGLPFYIAAPMSTVDFGCPDGGAIPIEDRAGAEVREVAGRDADGRPATVRIAPDDLPVANPAFDVTPARLITGIITEHGICAPSALHDLPGAER